MNTSLRTKVQKEKTIIRKCHCCGQVHETAKEIEKCISCGKSFLPLNYFDKIHAGDYKFEELFAESHHLEEEDLISGLYVLW